MKPIHSFYILFYILTSIHCFQICHQISDITSLVSDRVPQNSQRFNCLVCDRFEGITKARGSSYTKPCSRLYGKRLESPQGSDDGSKRRAKKSQNTNSNNNNDDDETEKMTPDADDETMVSEAELKMVWKRSRRPSSLFSVEAALMLLLDQDEDDDTDDAATAAADQSATDTRSMKMDRVNPMSSKQRIGSSPGLAAFVQKLQSNMLEQSSSSGTINRVPNGDVKKTIDISSSSRANSQFSDSMKSAKFNAKQKGVSAGPPAGRSVGIDLGTTFSAVSLVELGRPKIIPVDGARITPSVVGYLQSGEIVVGEPARRQLVVNPQNSFASVKRVIGRSLEECEATGDNLAVLRVDRSRSGAACVLKCPVLGRPLLPEEVSAEVLRKLLRAAQEYVGDEPITKAVITVPAYFLPNQCAATEKAGKLAGLEKVKLLREPEAAALAYGLARKSPQIVLVFDLGGGTFDVSVLEVGGGLVEVIATSGDAHLGGDDFNAVIVNWIFEQFAAEHGLDRSNSLRGNVFASSRIYEAAESAKIELSSKTQVEIRVPFVMDGVSIAYNLTRAKFESMSKGLLRRLLRPVREAAVMAGVNLPGESGLMGVIDEDNDLYSSAAEEDGIDAMFNPDSATAPGADIESNPAAPTSESSKDLTAKDMRRLQQMGQRSAREKNKLKGDTMKQVRTLQRSTGDSTLGSFPGGQPLNEVLLVGGASRMPAVQRLVRVVTGVEPHRSVHPDEAVSLGAAVMAGILDGHISGMEVVSAWQAAVYRTLFEERDRLQGGEWAKGKPNNTDNDTAPTKKSITKGAVLTRSRNDPGTKEAPTALEGAERSRPGAGKDGVSKSPSTPRRLASFRRPRRTTDE